MNKHSKNIVQAGLLGRIHAGYCNYNMSHIKNDLQIKIIWNTPDIQIIITITPETQDINPLTVVACGL